jgi:hypothetical protein
MTPNNRFYRFPMQKVILAFITAINNSKYKFGTIKIKQNYKLEGIFLHIKNYSLIKELIFINSVKIVSTLFNKSLFF